MKKKQQKKQNSAPTIMEFISREYIFSLMTVDCDKNLKLKQRKGWKGGTTQSLLHFHMGRKQQILFKMLLLFQIIVFSM